MLDEALLRPGRLEVQVEIGLADEKGRHQNTEGGPACQRCKICQTVPPARCCTCDISHASAMHTLSF